jgi:hypothetical protein
MGKGKWKWVRDGRDKGMDSALSQSKWKGTPGRGGKLAAASRRERFRFCSCYASLCLSQELAEELVVELVAASPCANQESAIR